MSAADGALEERRFLVRSWRHDICAAISDLGKMIESDTYSAYGAAFGVLAGDTDANGTSDSTDYANMSFCTYREHRRRRSEARPGDRRCLAGSTDHGGP